MSAENPHSMWLHGVACLLGDSEAAESRERAIPHAVNVPERVSAALMSWGLASRLLNWVIKNPSHIKSGFPTVRERAFLRVSRKTRRSQHLIMGVIGVSAGKHTLTAWRFVVVCNISQKMRYELDSQIPATPGS